MFESQPEATGFLHSYQDNSWISDDGPWLLLFTSISIHYYPVISHIHWNVNIAAINLIWKLYIMAYFSCSLEPQWLKEETLWLDNELVRWASAESSSPHESFRHTYPCKMCGKVFKTCSSLSKHKDVHRGTTRCLVCNTVLSRASYLKQHMASIHGLPPQW